MEQSFHGLLSEWTGAYVSQYLFCFNNSTDVTSKEVCNSDAKQAVSNKDLPLTNETSLKKNPFFIYSTLYTYLHIYRYIGLSDHHIWKTA